MTSLLIVSDIHAAANNLDRDDAVSWVSTLPEFDTDLRNPFRSIPDLIRSEKLTVDYLVCPGDIADRADPIAQATSWRFLDELRSGLGARRLIATVGNHDMDSRLKLSEFDPKATLQSLCPGFPGLSESECDFFWSRNYVILDEAPIRFLVVNSCAFHGIHSDEKVKSEAEYLHGRVSDRTISEILKRLNNSRSALNILIVHHHIYKNEHITRTDYSEMSGGGKLLRSLVDKNVGPWLVIHGHQHYPDLFYGSGSASSAAILSAGSMSRRLSGALLGRSLNQIYHVELPIDAYNEIGWKPAGYTRAWDWVDQIGWKRTSFQREGVSIPFGSGFGCRKDAEIWATEIVNELRTKSKTRVSWEELMVRWSALRYVLPADLRKILLHLQSVEGVKTYYDEDGLPAEINL